MNTFVPGSPATYNFIDDNLDISVAPVFYTKVPRVIARSHRRVSIRSAPEVDLHGQIIVDTIGPRSFSDAAGRQDFTAETGRSLEHVSLICLQSTATVNGELKSRIIGAMTSHSTVPSPRQLAGVIVTEYGSTDLRELTAKERAAASTSIAQPQFRDELDAAAESLGR